MALPTFGFIAEGKTDFAVLENILVGYFDDKTIPTKITHLQPNDETDTQFKAAHGGFSLVIDYCTTEKFRQNWLFQDYTIISIDTDRLHDVDIPIANISVEQIVQNVIDFFNTKIKRRFGDDFYEAYKSKIIFAIAVNAIECWLLPLYFTKNDARDKQSRAATHNCKHILEKQVGKSVKKDYSFYDTLSSGFIRQKTLLAVYSHNPSLQLFIENLEQHIL